ncbi:MAG TPA: GAF domain-containing protein [Blastocatellia bacterium]|nr:GAF domain-containing protein [Blastocatellia bacterium]
MNNNEDSACASVRRGKRKQRVEPLVSRPASSAPDGNLESENQSLRELVRELKKEVDHLLTQQDYFRRQMKDADASTQQLLCDYLELQRQNTHLANLYVASSRLHGTMNRREGLETIQEIIINLIGSEELAIFELEETDSVLSLLSSVGIDSHKYQTIPVDSGPIGCTVISGKSYLAGQSSIENYRCEELDLTACVPIRLNGKVRGVIAIFHLLQQKNGFETTDYELLDLLADQAATAIYRTGPAHVVDMSEVD